MAFADDYAASLDPRVISQVTAAIYAELQNIESESAQTPNHVQRLAIANKIALGTQPLQPLILSACSFAALNSTTPDATVSNTVATLWNLWSGV